MASLSQGRTPSERRALSASQQGDPVADAVGQYSRRVADKLGRGGDKEEQLRAPVEELFLNLGRILGLQVVPYGEVRIPEFGVRPDYAIDIGRDRIGYIELKAPGVGVPPSWNKDPIRNSHQYERMRDLPNLLYCDGSSWRLFELDKPLASVVSLEGNLEDGTLTPPGDGSFHDLINKFLGWSPEPPRTLNKLIRVISGPCRMLRRSVAELIAQEAEQRGASTFTQLAEDWRNLLFPKLADKDFPDAYSQSVTFALLLAREGGISFEGRSLRDIAEQLGKQHALMGRVLYVLTHKEAVQKLKILDTLRVVIGAVDWQALPAKDRSRYWDLYEPFLSEYDSDLRQQSGSYYTPEPVARFMVDFTDQILQDRLKLKEGFADDNVSVMDPAMGTGTFLVEVIRTVADKTTRDHNKEYAGAVLRDLCRRRLIGFERSAAPYVVTELRLHQTLKDVYKVEPPEQSMRFLTNTLDNPDQPHGRGLEYTEIAESRDRADYIKRKRRIVAILGNPPYVTRAHQRDPAPWIETSRTRDGVDPVDRPALDDFRERGNGKLEYPLSNTGTFFWRWSTWKVFDCRAADGPGVVALITTSAYLTGPAFAGMRRYLRETCDEGWIIDLSPEGQRPPVSTRVFRGVKEPVCIGIFVRKEGESKKDKSATIRYCALDGVRDHKFSTLEEGLDLDGPAWRRCPGGWTDDFLPEDDEWVSHPQIEDITKWAQPGVKPGLTWVYAPRPEVLEGRWSLFSAVKERELFFKDPVLPGRKMPESLREVEDCPPIEECAFRAFDRQYILADNRLADRLRRSLWDVRSRHQVFASIQHDKALKHGPGIIFSELVPDQHHFAARGGKVIPLYKTRQAQDWASNVPENFRSYLTSRLGMEAEISPAEVFAYIAGIAAHPGYVEKFWESLRRPGVRIPITAEKELWSAICEVGARVIWLHTFGSRFCDVDKQRPEGSPRLPRNRRPEIVEELSDREDDMPDSMHYDSVSQLLHIGSGAIGPVAGKVIDYQVCGKRVVDQWFSFRQRTRRHQRRTSPLDDKRVGAWTYHLSRDLLNLVNVLGMLVDIEPQQSALLDAVCNSPLITRAQLKESNILPISELSRKPPKLSKQDELPFRG